VKPVRPAAIGDSTAELCVRRLGRQSYADACALQSAAASAVAAGGPDQLLLLEHPSVVTVGRSGGQGQIRVSAAELKRRGVALVDTDRGGGATYHGPGQVVGYPIVDLRRRRISPRGYLRALEGALAGALIEQGLQVFLRAGLTGVWAPEGKVAAIGIAVRRGIARHGFALNVDVDLEMFDLLVPCGLTEPVTSMRAMGWRGSRCDLMRGLARHLGGALNHVERKDDSVLDGPPSPYFLGSPRLAARTEAGI